jgi:hypothetical protein
MTGQKLRVRQRRCQAPPQSRRKGKQAKISAVPGTGTRFPKVRYKEV